MEFNLLTTIGIILILSSSISLVLLLRKNIKQCVKSFIFILILSDVLSNIFIGVILLAKQKNPTHLNEQETESGILRDNNDNDKNEDEYNNYLLINKCDFKSLLMNYAVFLVPFVNNFMSLLTKSFYCNYNIECIKKKYKQLILSKLISTDLSTVERRRSRLSFFKYLNNNNNNNNIFTIISVISQWIIPILSIMILYLTGYENITTDIRSYELTCIHMTNFPFDNCYNNNNINNNNNNNNSNKLEEEFNPLEEMDSMYGINMMNSTDYLLPDNKLDAIESVTSNGSETNEIVIKIQEIVQSALNNSESTPEWYFSKILPLKKLNFSRSRLTKGRKVDIDYMFEDELTSACMSDNKCFISPNVLKMNMIIVIFIVYFGSILLSTVYCIKSNYICSNIKQQLITVESMDKLTDNNKPGESNVKDRKLNDQGGSSDSIKWINSNIDFKSVAGVIKEETSEIEKIIYISVISLLLAVLLWTPVFMQLIAKIFMCMEMSYWSMNVFYFTAMGYGVIRNFLDVDMVKTKGIVPQVLSDSC